MMNFDPRPVGRRTRSRTQTHGMLLNEVDSDPSTSSSSSASNEYRSADLELGPITDTDTSNTTANNTKQYKTKSKSKPKAKQIDWDKHDKNHPKNWSLSKKWGQTLLLSLMTFIVQSSGSNYSPTQSSISKTFDVSYTTSVLGISLLLLGFAVTPLFLAPVSEYSGRRPVYLVGFALFLVFLVPVAVTRSIGVLLAFRFLEGCAGSPDNTTVGGSVTDMFDTPELGGPMTAFIALGLLMPTPMGPLVNGAVVRDVRMGWRWVFWIQLVFGGLVFVFLVFFVKETREGVILKQRAKRITKETGIPHEAKSSGGGGGGGGMMQVFKKKLMMPWKMLFTDIVVALFSLWLAFAWGVTYGMLQSIPLVFETCYNFNIRQIGLVYISLIVGIAVAWLGTIPQNMYFKRKLEGRGDGKHDPEARLQISCVGSVAMTVGLFGYAWTSTPHVHYMAPASFVGLVYAGIFGVYYGVFLYICDNYADEASSALSAVGFARNMLAAAFPLFTKPFYVNLGYGWASSTLGFLSIPIGATPFLLIAFGDKLRKRSRFIED